MLDIIALNRRLESRAIELPTGGGNLPLPTALSLQGRRALVAGAASGIGRATAQCLGRLGAAKRLTPGIV